MFNRPDTTRRVLGALSEVRPTRLYVAADGPRTDVSTDERRCDETRALVSDIDWPCEVRTLYRDQNLGTRAAVTGGIDWFFAHEDEGIILEDDCLPDRSFFRFAAALLDRYRDDMRVGMISADGFHPRRAKQRHSYSFHRYPYIWGWATWRRAWAMNESEMKDWPALRATEWLAEIGDGHNDFVEYWTKRFDEVHDRRLDTWDYAWVYSCWRHGLLSIVPTRNLVVNLGFGSEATHTKALDWRARLSLEAMEFPLVHPPSVESDPVFDRWADLNVFGTKSTRMRRLLRTGSANPLGRAIRRRFRRFRHSEAP